MKYILKFNESKKYPTVVNTKMETSYSKPIIGGVVLLLSNPFENGYRKIYMAIIKNILDVNINKVELFTQYYVLKEYFGDKIMPETVGFHEGDRERILNMKSNAIVLNDNKTPIWRVSSILNKKDFFNNCQNSIKTILDLYSKVYFPRTTQSKLPLLEKSIYDIRKFDDIITHSSLDNYIKHLTYSDNFEDYYVCDYRYENDIDEDIEDDVIASDEDFKFWLRNRIWESFNNILIILKNKIRSDGTITIHRAMKVKDNWYETLEKEGKHLGIYWTYDEHKPEAYCGNSQPNEAIIITKVNEKYINWNETILLNMDVTLGYEEREIRLFKNTPLKIERLIINNQEVDITSIKNKVFYA